MRHRLTLQFRPDVRVGKEGFGVGEIDQTGYLVRHKGVHDRYGDARHLSDRKISDDPMGGVGSADSYMVALVQTKGGKEIRYAAEFRIHLAVGIVVATGGVLGGTVLGEIAVREGGLIPVGADSFREDI